MELIGAKLPSINKAEDRELFKQAMKKIGLKTPPSGTVETWEQAIAVCETLGRTFSPLSPSFAVRHHGEQGGGTSGVLRLGQGQRWTCLGPFLKRWVRMHCATSCRHVVAFTALCTGSVCGLL